MCSYIKQHDIMMLCMNIQCILLFRCCTCYHFISSCYITYPFYTLDTTSCVKNILLLCTHFTVSGEQLQTWSRTNLPSHLLSTLNSPVMKSTLSHLLVRSPMTLMNPWTHRQKFVSRLQHWLLCLFRPLNYQ